MIFHPQRSIRITDRSSIGEARRVSAQLAERSRLKEVEVGRVSLIVTELATNLLPACDERRNHYPNAPDRGNSWS